MPGIDANLYGPQHAGGTVGQVTSCNQDLAAANGNIFTVTGVIKIKNLVGTVSTVLATSTSLRLFAGATAITAKNVIDITAAANRGYLHDLFYDATGITGSTSTEFCNGAASDDWLVERCAFYVDAAQGDAFTLASPVRWTWQDNDFYVGLTGIAWASVFTFATSALGSPPTTQVRVLSLW